MAKKDKNQRQGVSANPGIEGLPPIVSANRKDWKAYSAKERDLLRAMSGKKSSAEASAALDALIVKVTQMGALAGAASHPAKQLKALLDTAVEAGDALLAAGAGASAPDLMKPLLDTFMRAGGDLLKATDRVLGEDLKELVAALEQAGKSLCAGEEEREAAEKAGEKLVAAQEDLLRRCYPDVDPDTLTNEAFLYLFKRTCAKSRGDELGN